MTDLDARYGRSAPTTRRLVVWLIGGVLVVAAIVWFIWARPIGTTTDAAWRDTGYRITDPSSEIVADWELTVEPGTAVDCAIYAMNQAFAIVGWRIVEIPASDVRIRQFSEAIRTSEPPVTGLVYRCWAA